MQRRGEHQPDVDEQFTDATGEVRRTDPATLRWIRERLRGESVASRDTDPVVVRGGDAWPHESGRVELEDGGSGDVVAGGAVELPLGYHRSGGDAGDRLVIVAPPSCPLPERREWGWAVQLYATRSRSSWGIGDLGDLRRVAEWSAAAGAGFVLVNPLCATAPGPHQQPSPYSPTSRRFLNPIYADVDALPVTGDAADRLARLAAAGRALNDERIIDRDRVLALKQEALELGFAADGAKHLDVDDPALRRFATWTAIAEVHGGDWRSWPEDLRRPDAAGVVAFADDHVQRIAFHAWTQRLLRRQLAEVSRHVRLVQDLPIGFDPGGFDAWCWQDLLALDASVGAPPDEFNTAGQDWGLPPFVPDRLRAAGYEPFVETVRACLADRGALRIDHVMGLFRLWWVPDGDGPVAGAYVRYPAEDLLAILALESHRAGAIVIGEDLGTTEEAALASLADHHVLSYKLLWFESAPPPEWNPRAFAAVTTHDLPTVAGLWDGSDLTAQQQLDLHPNVEGTQEMRERLRDAAHLADDASAGDAVRGAYRLLAASPALLLAATFDDAIAEPQRPNIPGADGGRPNWSLALPVTLEEIEDGALTADIAAALSLAVVTP